MHEENSRVAYRSADQGIGKDVEAFLGSHLSLGARGREGLPATEAESTGARSRQALSPPIPNRVELSESVEARSRELAVLESRDALVLARRPRNPAIMVLAIHQYRILNALSQKP